MLPVTCSQMPAGFTACGFFVGKLVASNRLRKKKENNHSLPSRCLVTNLPMNTKEHHQTRDHRFAYISAGDIGFWAKSTSGFQRPNKVRTKQEPFVPVENIEELKAFQAKMTIVQAADTSGIVTPSADRDGSVRAEMAKCEKTVQLVADRLAISDRINRILQPQMFRKGKR